MQFIKVMNRVSHNKGAFCNNQYRIFEDQSGSGADNLEQVFESRLDAIKRLNGRMVAVLDSWEQPADQKTTYIGRLWCIYEQYTAQKLSLPVDITLPKNEADEFLDALTDNTRGLPFVQKTVSTIDCMNAKASNPKDEEKVREIIKNPDEVNKEVRQRFSRWCGEALAASLVRRPLPQGDLL